MLSIEEVDVSDDGFFDIEERPNILSPPKAQIYQNYHNFIKIESNKITLLSRNQKEISEKIKKWQKEKIKKVGVFLSDFIKAGFFSGKCDSVFNNYKLH